MATDTDTSANILLSKSPIQSNQDLFHTGIDSSSINNDPNDLTRAHTNEHQHQQQQQQQNQNKKSLEIKTKSIENTLLPLINQISTLVNFKDNLKLISCSEKTLNALLKVGESVNLAVERFVSVGEAIAFDHAEIKAEMLNACLDAKNAGLSIKMLTEIKFNETNTLTINDSTNSNKMSITQAANNLLNAIIKVLLLADVVIINQIINAKNKVLLTLNKLESVNNGFWMFVKLFTQYGSDMIELAHLTGERQSDLKNDKRRSQLSSARWILERSTIMILNAAKTYFKHPECDLAKDNLNLIYTFIKQALDAVHYVVIDSGSLFESVDTDYHLSIINDMSFTKALRHFEDTLDMARNNMINESNIDCILNASSNLIDSTQDFTDSLYINNEQRDKLMKLQNDIREQTNSFIQIDECLDDVNKIQLTRIFKTTPILQCCEMLKKHLQSQTIYLVNCLFKENKDAILLNLIRTYATSGHYDLLLESLSNFKDYSEQVLEICKMLRHVSSCDVLEATCEHHYNIFNYLEKMIPLAAETCALYPTCKIANENLSIYCDTWENQINDLSVLVKEIQDLLNGVKSEKTVYLSLPRPGKHGTSARVAPISTKATKLDVEEQAKIAKLGLEMKLITSEIEAEADKWNEPQNEIVKLAKIMSDMAYSIHLFTKGEGSLKTTQDLFVKASSFLQQAVILYAIIKDFTISVPNGYLKEELLVLLEKLPINCQQLKNRLKQVTVGKTATFNKVDGVIQETRDLMNLVAKLVTNCFICSTKYNINTGIMANRDETVYSPQSRQAQREQNLRYLNQLRYNEQYTYYPNNYIFTPSTRSESCGPTTTRASSLQRTFGTNNSNKKYNF